MPPFSFRVEQLRDRIVLITELDEGLLVGFKRISCLLEWVLEAQVPCRSKALRVLVIHSFIEEFARPILDSPP